ncbi:MAG: type II toxin-antitoxin system HicB family antitoxin [Dysgonamonadaceae bacterium]|nr:type II toxin-antitoxin system HicB family antitoxin [Dysgonamonadaceae bacterium]MDR3219599.1 type II toxin-antitoxin system HicB family antitoxin [Dysgonamonadaceae bacterium]
MNSDLHRRAAITAKQHGYTLNAFVKESIERRLEYTH